MNQKEKAQPALPTWNQLTIAAVPVIKISLTDPFVVSPPETHTISQSFNMKMEPVIKIDEFAPCGPVVFTGVIDDHFQGDAHHGSARPLATVTNNLPTTPTWEAKKETFREVLYRLRYPGVYPRTPTAPRQPCRAGLLDRGRGGNNGGSPPYSPRAAPGPTPAPLGEITDRKRKAEHDDAAISLKSAADFANYYKSRPRTFAHIHEETYGTDAENSASDCSVPCKKKRALHSLASMKAATNRQMARIDSASRAYADAASSNSANVDDVAQQMGALNVSDGYDSDDGSMETMPDLDDSYMDLDQTWDVDTPAPGAFTGAALQNDNKPIPWASVGFKDLTAVRIRIRSDSQPEIGMDSYMSMAE